jgi:hypothetical protein
VILGDELQFPPPLLPHLVTHATISNTRLASRPKRLRAQTRCVNARAEQLAIDGTTQNFNIENAARLSLMTIGRCDR